MIWEVKRDGLVLVNKTRIFKLANCHQSQVGNSTTFTRKYRLGNLILTNKWSTCLPTYLFCVMTVVKILTTNDSKLIGTSGSMESAWNGVGMLWDSKKWTAMGKRKVGLLRYTVNSSVVTHPFLKQTKVTTEFSPPQLYMKTLEGSSIYRP